MEIYQISRTTDAEFKADENLKVFERKSVRNALLNKIKRHLESNCTQKNENDLKNYLSDDGIINIALYILNDALITSDSIQSDIEEKSAYVKEICEVQSVIEDNKAYVKQRKTDATMTELLMEYYTGLINQEMMFAISICKRTELELELEDLERLIEPLDELLCQKQWITDQIERLKTEFNEQLQTEIEDSLYS